jgi:hypothetical protein
MPDLMMGLQVGASLLGSSMQADAASEASAAQVASAEAGIAEQRRQFDAMRELLKPYVSVGTTAIEGLAPFQVAGVGAVPILQQYAQAGPKAFEQQQALAGVLGPERQREAIAQIESGGGFQASVQAGEEALLQRASATGGLRGGNIQAALSQFRPQMLQQEIERQFGRLGGFADIGRETQGNLLKIGQASAAGVGAQGVTTGTNIANLLANQGRAIAGGQLGEARAYGKFLEQPFQLSGFTSAMGSETTAPSPGQPRVAGGYVF